MGTGLGWASAATHRPGLKRVKRGAGRPVFHPLAGFTEDDNRAAAPAPCTGTEVRGGGQEYRVYNHRSREAQRGPGWRFLGWCCRTSRSPAAETRAGPPQTTTPQTQPSSWGAGQAPASAQRRDPPEEPVAGSSVGAGPGALRLCPPVRGLGGPQAARCPSETTLPSQTRLPAPCWETAFPAARPVGRSPPPSPPRPALPHSSAGASRGETGEDAR